jgi:hypothetical protein
VKPSPNIIFTTLSNDNFGASVPHQLRESSFTDNTRPDSRQFDVRNLYGTANARICADGFRQGKTHAGSRLPTFLMCIFCERLITRDHRRTEARQITMITSDLGTVGHILGIQRCPSLLSSSHALRLEPHPRITWSTCLVSFTPLPLPLLRRLQSDSKGVRHH